MYALLLAIQSAVLPAPPAPPPPPPVITIPAPPPMIRTNLAPLPVRVRVTAGRELLLEDRMQVGQWGANVRRSRAEGMEGRCGRTDGPRTNNFSLQLNRLYGSGDEQKVRVTVDWDRPPVDACASGSRGIRLNQVVDLGSGAGQVIEGDAGLRVEIRADR